MSKKERILITGSSGFIGMQLSEKLLKEGIQILGIDNMNDYYSPKLKKDRLTRLFAHENFRFENINISNFKDLIKSFEKFKPDKVVNLAAQAGVRYSLENPNAYIESNIAGFMNVLECCRILEVKGLIYASSSSVYGANKKLPFSERDSVSKPMSIYGASKRSNELMAHTYSNLHQIKTTGLRFFTAYGPWGRPDMAMYIFANRIIKKQKITVFNHGKMKRDFTFIDDIVNGIKSAIEKNYQCEIFNIGNNKSISLMYLIQLIEEELAMKANINFMDIQKGDVANTLANISYSRLKLDYNPKTSIEDGIRHFIKWFKLYNKV